MIPTFVRSSLFSFLILLIPVSPLSSADTRVQPDAETALHYLYQGGTQHLEAGRRDAARSVLRELERQARDFGDPEWIGRSLWILGYVVLTDGEMERSLSYFEEALGYLEDAAGGRTNLDFEETYGLVDNIGSVSWRTGELMKAVQTQRELEEWARSELNQRTGESLGPDFFDPEEGYLASGGRIPQGAAIFSNEYQVRAAQGETESALADLLALADTVEESGQGGWEDIFIRGKILSEALFLMEVTGLTEDYRKTVRQLTRLPVSLTTSGPIAFARIRETHFRGMQSEIDIGLAIEQIREGIDDLEKGTSPLLAQNAGRYLAALLEKAGKIDEAIAVFDQALENQEPASPDLDAWLRHGRTIILSRNPSKTSHDLNREFAKVIDGYRISGLFLNAATVYGDFSRFLFHQNRHREAFSLAILEQKHTERFEKAGKRNLREDLLDAWALFPPDEERSHAATLHPKEIRPRPPVDSPARARFTLSNPTPKEATGRLEIDGATSISVEPSGAVTGAATGQSDDVFSQEITIPPLDYITLFVEIAPDSGDRMIPIHWRSESGERLESVIHPGSNNLQAATIKRTFAGSPFDFVDFYHEFPEDIASKGGLRARADRPVRIEYIDAASKRLIAVDANGDGVFTGKGEVVFGPGEDLALPQIPSSSNGPAALELFVYPEAAFDANTEPAKEVEVVLEVRTENQWREEARFLIQPTY